MTRKQDLETLLHELKYTTDIFTPTGDHHLDALAENVGDAVRDAIDAVEEAISEL